MLPDTSTPPRSSIRCEACGAPGDPVLLELPFPADLLRNLGLPEAQTPRTLCGACAAKGLRGGKLDLLDLVERAPASVRQAIHTHLMKAFEI